MMEEYEESQELKLSGEAFRNRKGFITKEEFLRMIKTLNFQYVASYDIKLVTGMIIDCKEDKANTLGYTIKLNEYKY